MRLGTTIKAGTLESPQLFFFYSALNSCLDIFCLLICTKPSNRYARQIWVTYEYK